MTKRTEFSKALKAFENCKVIDAMDLVIMHGGAIGRALKIADKLMQEPSYVGRLVREGILKDISE